MAILYALISAIVIGVADVFGSIVGRRGRILALALWMMAVGIPCLVVMGVLVDGEILIRDMLIGLLSGVFGAGALLFLYAGYSRSRIGVVAPTTAVVGATVPVAVGLMIDGLPSSMTLVGIGLGLPAIGLLGWNPQSADSRMSRSALMFGGGAGAMFGIMGVLLGLTSEDAGVWPALGTRTAATAVLVIGGLAMNKPLLPYRDTWRYIIPAGILASGGVALFVLAAQRNITIAGLLIQGAFAVTVIGGIVLFGESSSRSQRIGFMIGAASLTFITLG